MKRIFITGMSGTGKSAVMGELRSRGFTAIDSDYDDWCDSDYDDWCESHHDGQAEWIWREERMYNLLNQPLTAPLFVSGCVSNQGKFYKFFYYKVLFSAPLEVILERVATRSSNSYGKTEGERAEICWNYEHIQPLLQKSADFEIDSAFMSIREITEFLVELALK